MVETLRVGEIEITAVSDGVLRTSLDNLVGMDRGEAEQLVGSTKRSPFAGTVIRSGRHAGWGNRPRIRRLADLIPHVSHQATALRRSRTEASSRRVDDAKRD